MNDRDEETFAQFARRFASVEVMVPDPPPVRSGIGLPQSMVTARLGASVLAGAALLAIVVWALLPIAAGRRPAQSPSSSAPAIVLATPWLTEPSPTAITTPAASPSPSIATVKVDVINGPRQVLVQIVFHTGVPRTFELAAGERATLIDELRGGLYPGEVFAPGRVIVAGNGLDDACVVVDDVKFSTESFTIVLDGPAAGPGYKATIQPGAPLTGPVAKQFVGGCSG